VHGFGISAALRCTAVSAFLAIIALPVPGMAAEKAFHIGTTSVFATGNSSDLGGLLLDDVGASGFYINFILPADYKANSTVRMVFTGRAATPVPCSVQFDASTLVRSRKNVASSEDDFGIRPKGGSETMEFTQPNVTVAKTYLLKPTQFFNGQKPGDIILVSMRRDATLPSDTCGNIGVTGIEIRYETKK